MITKNYIKMCEEAEEIQKAWMPEVGDRRIDKRDRSEGFIESQGIDYIRSKSALKMIHIYLPTQEQLQEIIKEDFLAEFGMIFKLYNWIDSGIHNGTFSLDIKEVTLNELWLAFVMERKYNKIWDSEKWK